MLPVEVGRILSSSRPVSRGDGLIAQLGPERSGRRGGRNGRLARAPHVERAHRLRANRRDRPLARTTTRRRFWQPWSSHEGRGSRGVGVRRSARVGPDWPVRPHPFWDASCSLPAAAAAFLARWLRGAAPALLGQPSASSGPRAVITPRSACCLAAPGAEFRRRSENGLTLRPHQLARKRIAYHIEYGIPRGGPLYANWYASSLPEDVS